MSMKFDIEKLQSKRVALETEMRQLKKILTQRHTQEAPTLQTKKYHLRKKLTFIYAAIAHMREKIHLQGMWPNEQAEWLVREIAVAKKYEELLKQYPNQNWIQEATFASGFFRTQEENSPVL